MDSGRLRGQKTKECRECGYYGRLNAADQCGSCEDSETGSSRRGQDGRQRHDECKHCSKRVGDRDQGIQCDQCGYWIHAQCEKVSPQLYNSIESGETKLWFCGECSAQVKKNLEEAKKLKKDNAEMKKELNGLKEGIEKMIKKMKEYRQVVEVMQKRDGREQGSGREKQNKREEITQLREEMKEFTRQMKGMQDKIIEVERKWVRMEEELKDLVTRTVLEVMEEKEDKQKRVKNVVIYNVTEPNAINLNVKEQKQHDLEKCMDIFTKGLDVEEVQIMETVRLGRQAQRDGAEEPRSRPLLVKLSEVQTKWEIVKTAEKLEDAKEEEYKKVYISPDLTAKERAKDKELRDSLKEKRENGERGCIISKGKLVRKNCQ